MEDTSAVKLTQTLIAIPSASGNEKELADYIEKFVKNYGTVYRFNNSLVLKITGHNNRKAFIINGHIDTVPGNEQWTLDPLKPTIKTGKLYGLGASDMKSGVAIMLTLADKFSKTKPECDILFMFVEKEEIDGSGTKLLLESLNDLSKPYRQGIEGLILEPTNAETVGVGSKGNIFCDLTFLGRGGHGSVSLNANERATYKMANFIKYIPEIEDKWRKRYSDKTLGKPTINVTNVMSLGGDAPNVVPQQIDLKLDIRTTPSLEINFNSTMNTLAKNYDFTYVLPHGITSPGLCPQNSYLLRIVTKKFGKTSLFQGATDQTFFTAKKIPMLIYGPGDNATMHQSDEFVTVKNIEKSQRKIEEIIENYCEL